MFVDSEILVVPRSASTESRAPRIQARGTRSMHNLGKVELDPKSIFSCKKVCFHLHTYMTHETHRWYQLTDSYWRYPSRSRNSPLLEKISENSRTLITYTYVSDSTREYRTAFEPTKISSCGDQNKPLVKYDPNAQRNRLPQDKFIPKSRNSSNIHFGVKNPRQFVTTNANSYRGETGLQSANRSIVANKVKFYHELQAR